jgi:hypothetical protein
MGGSLILRDSIVVETTGGARAAIEIQGGSVNLVRELDPGGNTINVSGAGESIRSTGTTSISAIGNTLQVDGVSLASNFRIEDEIHHALDANGLGLVTYVAGNVFVSTASGSIQRGVDAVTSGGAVNCYRALKKCSPALLMKVYC